MECDQFYFKEMTLLYSEEFDKFAQRSTIKKKIQTTRLIPFLSLDIIK